MADHVVVGNAAAFLEVTDLMAGQVRYIPVPESPESSPYAAWYKQTYPDKVNVNFYGPRKGSGIQNLALQIR